MSNLVAHAKKEFALAGWDKPETDGMQQMICEQILELIELFASHGHSGSSAMYAIGMFHRLVQFEPISPLTGEAHEWGTEVSPNQNNRCSRVFRDEDGTAYDSKGKVFVEAGGVGYLSGDSRVPVTFPYTPKTEYINVE